MNKRIITLMAAVLALLSAVGQVTFTGGDVATYRPIVAPESTKDFTIFVIHDTQDVIMHYPSANGERPKVCSYESYPDEIAGVKWNGFEITLNQVKEGGYIIDDNYHFWVVNYADHTMELNDLFFSSEMSCDLLSFTIDGHAEAITYNRYKGLPQVLDRGIELTYKTLVWDDKNNSWEEQTVVENFAALDQGVEITPPLCETVFLLTGDRFLREWNLDEEGAKNDDYKPQAVSCSATAVQDNSDPEEEEQQSTELGGSAPFTIVFTGYPTDAAVYRVWEMATDEDFENVIRQEYQDVFEYYFNECGTFYFRYVVANAAGTCENTSETFRVTVDESELPLSKLLPNVLSPGNVDGVDRVWKVPAKSMVEFHCWIYNRWGTLVYEFTDPNGGWNGTYKGKLVDTGVYFYVIKATGSDGKKYERHGDINVLKYKGTRGSSNSGVGN